MAELDRQVAESSDDCLRYKNGDYWNIAYITLEVGYQNASYQAGGGAARFLNVTIPQGATITTAYLTFTAYQDKDPTVVNTRIRAQDADNAITFSTMEDFDARAWTDAYVNWDAIPAWTEDVEYDSPEIKTVIQEVINRPGWESGNALVILWDDWEKRSTKENGRLRQAHSYDSDPAKAPQLHIEYEVVAVVGRSFGFIIG